MKEDHHLLSGNTSWYHYNKLIFDSPQTNLYAASVYPRLYIIFVKRVLLVYSIVSACTVNVAT